MHELSRHTPDVLALEAATQGPAKIDLPDLVAQVYESAPQEERRALLAMLLRPLGLLSLAAIGNGIFAHLRLHGGWPDFRPPGEDLNRVRASDIAALVHHVQQVSIETVQGLAVLLKGSPVLAGSAAAAMLVAVLLQRRRRSEPATRGDAVDSAG